MEDGTSIRPAVQSDTVGLASLCAEHAAFERLGYVADGHAARLAAAMARGEVKIWVACAGEQLVGYAALTREFSTLAGSAYLHMDCLYVRAAWRNRRIGERLMAELQTFGRQLRYAALQWQTPDWNHDAIRFYRRLGASQLVKARFRLAI
ncbi:GNAT family N-acetyltransferase [Chitinimonas arctica]|uniref:GNAT family N-acetyltransferase n=1 Tax=Chitinimonas arctica TaxID=2594795 RepID=A0A516SDN1_9NEIS|nr:GNAT family N-acetyltransferase [Chitinimonas arctica]QDQ26251.1 GNAT family N-acetyltransferase [Chitinimonas arctica]